MSTGDVMRELLHIFFVFARIGALTFGGGYSMLPLMRRELTIKLGWLADEDVINYFAVAQCLPGVIAINTSMLVGYRRRKLPGLLAAGLGMALPSIIIILIIAGFITGFMETEAVGHAFNGIRAAVLALILNTAVKMWATGVKDIFGVIIFAASLGAFVCLAVSPAVPVICGIISGIIIKERSNRKGQQ
ncbi:MAG: chromate transporter [Clostridiales bacterium]|jgi:chromate transporter|nr:chromate transporter [Clostridiales bacterium]